MSEPATYRNALPLNTMLLEYRLESVLGAGGFGLTYLGWDTNLEKHVAIKEYLPGELAVRALDGSVVPVNTEHEYNYKWGLDRFIQEARTLAKFSHPNIVRVNRFFEAKGTSYMVMDYEAGDSLYQQLKRAPMPEEATLKSILLPIIDGLQAVHQAGFLHRDIKPSNVFIRKNGSPVLLDFGSARLATGSISKNLTAIVSPGYAPLEQYTKDGNQGPWTDIYGLSGVIYRAITSENPPDAVKRMKADTVPQTLTAARTRYSERFLKAIEWGMRLDEKMRPQSVAEWRDLFSGRLPMTALNRGTPSTDAATANAAANAATQKSPGATAPVTQRAAATRVLTPRRWKWMRRGAFMLILALAVTVFVRQRAMEREMRQQAAAQAQAPLSPAQPAQPAQPAVPAAAEQSLNAPPQPAEVAAAAPQPAPVMPTPAPDNASESPAEARPGAGEEGARIPPSIKKEFMAADRNGDGYLSPDEVKGRFPFIERNFPLIDSDHDGRISLGELWQLRRKQREMKQRQ